MTTETVRLDALVSLLLRRGYYPVAPECAGEGAQLINGQWHMPRWGCDTLQYVIEEHGDELANAIGQRGAACGASAAPTGCASNGDTEDE